MCFHIATRLNRTSLNVDVMRINSVLFNKNTEFDSRLLRVAWRLAENSLRIDCSRKMTLSKCFARIHPSMLQMLSMDVDPVMVFCR